jgi:hypothetical protein
VSKSGVGKSDGRSLAGTSLAKETGPRDRFVRMGADTAS